MATHIQYGDISDHTPSQGGDDRLRVLVVIPSAVIGGAELWQLRLAAATPRLAVTVLALADGAAADAWRGRGVPVSVIPVGRRASDVVAAIPRVTGYVRQVNPDVVLAHGVKAALVGLTAARLASTRGVWVRHDNSFDGILVDILAMVSDGQIATSGALRTRPARLPTAVIAPPRLVERPASRAEARARLGLPVDDEDLVLGMVTRLVPSKGVDDAVLALTEPTAGGWKLVVIGVDDPAFPDERSRLAEMAARAGVTDRVILLKGIEGAGLLLAAFDAVAVLTKPVPGERTSTESFGMVALEAITCGVPVIAIHDIASRIGDAAVAVAPAAPAGVAYALHRLQDPQLRAQLGKAARAAAASFPDAPAVADHLARYLARAAQRPGAGRTGDAPMSVVTTVLNEGQATETLLAMLLPQLGDDDEIIVVDGGSTDGTTDVVDRWAHQDPRITLVVAPGTGISQGRNAGIAAATNPVVACTDAGCEPDPGWLHAFRAAIADDGGVDLWTGTYSPTVRGHIQRAMAAAGYPDRRELLRPGLLVRAYTTLFGRGFDPTLPTGRSMAVTKEAWARVGGFPEHLATGEDVTFGRAIVASGGEAVMVADAHVRWHQRPSLRASLRMYFRYGQASGHSLDRRLLARDVIRLLAYPASAAVLSVGGPVGRTSVMLGVAAYLSLPLARAARGPSPIVTLVLVPPVVALRDWAKALGAVDGLRHR